MASWAQGNLVRAKNAMDAMNMGTEARLKGGAALGNSLQNLLGLGFQGWQNQLQRKHERGQLNTQIQGEKDLQKLLAMIEAQGAGGFDMTPEMVPPSPRPGQTTTETEQMPLEERYTPAQQQIKDMMLKPRWKTEAQVETSNYQTALKTAKDMWGSKWDTLSPSQKRFEVTTILHGHYYAPTTGTDKKEWGDQEELFWVMSNMLDWGQNSEKGRQYSAKDASGNYIISGQKADTADVVVNVLYDRSRLVPQLKKKYPTRELFDQFMKPIVENQLGKPLSAGGAEQGPGVQTAGQGGGFFAPLMSGSPGVAGDLLPQLREYKKYLSYQDQKMADDLLQKYDVLNLDPVNLLDRTINWNHLYGQQVKELLDKAMQASRSQKMGTEQTQQKKYQEEHMQDYMQRYK
jgi:hypothetical protein